MANDIESLMASFNNATDGDLVKMANCIKMMQMKRNQARIPTSSSSQQPLNQENDSNIESTSQRHRMSNGDIEPNTEFHETTTEAQKIDEENSNHIKQPIQNINGNDLSSVQLQEETKSITFANQNRESILNELFEHNTERSACVTDFEESIDADLSDGAISMHTMETNAVEINEENSNQTKEVQMSDERGNSSPRLSSRQLSPSSSEENVSNIGSISHQHRMSIDDIETNAIFQETTTKVLEINEENSTHTEVFEMYGEQANASPNSSGQQLSPLSDEEQMKNPLQNINENDLPIVQSQEEMETIKFQNENELVEHDTEGSMYVTVYDETMEVASTNGEMLMHTMETNALKINEENSNQTKEVQMSDERGSVSPSSSSQQLSPSTSEENIYNIDTNAEFQETATRKRILGIDDENTNHIKEIQMYGERDIASISSSGQQLSPLSDEEQMKDALGNIDKYDLPSIQLQEELDSITFENQIIECSAYVTVCDETMEDTSSNGPPSMQHSTNYTISGNYVRELVLAAIGPLDSEKEASQSQIQTADSTTSSEIQMDPLSDVVEMTSANGSTCRPKRARKANPKYDYPLQQTRGTKKKDTANDVRMPLPENPTNPKYEMAMKKRQSAIRQTVSDVRSKNKKDMANLQSENGSTNLKFEMAMKKRQSTIRKTVSFAEPIEDDARMQLAEKPTNSKFEMAMKKRQSAIRQTVSGAHPKKKKDMENLHFGNGSTNAFARNTNAQMYAKNTLYQTLCVFCNQNCRFIVNHYVAAHPEKEAPIARPSPSMAEKLRSQIHNVKRANGKTEALCFFCEENKSFTTNGWERHLLTHTGERSKMFICKTCDTEFYAKANHNKNCGGNSIKIYCENSTDGSITGFMCNDCNYIQISRDRMVKHLKNQHNVKKPAEKRHFMKLILVAPYSSNKKMK